MNFSSHNFLTKYKIYNKHKYNNTLVTIYKFKSHVNILTLPKINS